MSCSTVEEPVKDEARLASDSRIVGWDCRRDFLIDEARVVEKFGVRPQSIPTGWGWWAMRLTAFPASLVGVKNPLLPYWQNTSTLRRSLHVRKPGG